MGMELADIDETAKDSLDVDNGVMVKRVVKDPARSAGVERGDILLMFNGEDIDDLEHFHELTEDVEEGKTYALLVLRSGSARFLAIKAEKK